MKNKALILAIVAIVAIAFVVWYFFIREAPTYLYKTSTLRAATYGPCSNPNSPLNWGNQGDPCCTGTVTCSYK